VFVCRRMQVNEERADTNASTKRPNVRAKSHRIAAEIEVPAKSAKDSAGYTLFVKCGHDHFKHAVAEGQGHSRLRVSSRSLSKKLFS
jgi:hypothetical protein